MDSLAERCAQVLRSNDRGAWTLPAPHLYPHQWAWDSAFAAIGWVHLDAKRAIRELASLVSGQWEDGRIPHIRFHPESRDYFPGPDFWETERTSSITQPPAWAIAARALVERGVDPADLAPLLPAFERSHLFFHEQRDPDGIGLVAVVHPWESGLDNCPAFDRALGEIDPRRAPRFERRDTRKVEDAAQRPTDDDYRRYAVLVKSIAGDGFGGGEWAVYDPLMTALLARAEEDLGALQDAAGGDGLAARRRASGLRDALLSHAWDERLGRFRYGRDAGAASPDVLGCYVPLILDLPETVRSRIVEGLEARFSTRFPLPTTAPSDTAFEPRRYWRGPTWINLNWLLAPQLGGDLVERTLQLVERSGIREYYHPETGEGLGAEDFTWTAALTLDLLRGAGA